MIFPERCPICGDVIAFDKRAGLHLHNADKLSGSRRAAHGVCGGITDDTRKLCYGGMACQECIDGLSYIAEPYCAKCGKQLDSADMSAMNAQNAGELLCSDCTAKQRTFIKCRCIMNYDEAARDMMADVKYNGRKEYLGMMSLLAADRLGTWIMEEARPDCLIPVPVHHERLRKRGYNQSELLCRGIGELLCIPVRPDIISRSKNTAAQKELTADRRLLNLQNAFTASGRLPEGSRVLIVDDIYTTGSTMEACTERLIEAGAAAVYGLCICAGENHAAGNHAAGNHAEENRASGNHVVRKWR